MIEAGYEQTVILTENLTRTQIVQYAGASGDYNPAHTDEPFAVRVAGAPTVFAHGMLTMAMTGTALDVVLPGAELATFGMRFTRQVWPGDQLAAALLVRSIVTDPTGRRLAEVGLVTKNGHGQDVASGYATVRLA